MPSSFFAVAKFPRATFTAIACNIVLKVIFVWAFHLGIAGVALGTSLGAWINVGQLVWQGRRHGLLRVSPAFKRAVGPILLAGIATGIGAYVAVAFGGRIVHLTTLREVVLLAFAFVLGAGAYGSIVLLFRKRLPLGRFAG